MGEASMIGLDIAKSVFQLHGTDATGHVVFRKRVARSGLLAFLTGKAPAVVAMEACGSAHHWGREIAALGHEVRLLPAAAVKPYVRRNKTDARDAEAIAEAARRPGLHVVPVKSVAQQCDRSLHRARDLLVRQRTQLINAIRGLLAEMGIVARQGAAGAAELLGRIERQDPAIPAALLPSLAALAGQWRAADEAARGLEREIMARARADEAASRLMTIPFVGPIIAHAVVAAIGDGRRFESARDFAAWVGLTPRTCASGLKQRQGRISRAGDSSLRRLFVLGATARLHHARTRPGKAGGGTALWLSGLLARRPVKVAAVALAAKMARVAWAILTSGQPYRESPAT